MKRTILFIALGAAFLAVSLWVILSGGRSARATHLKYRLGGALLSLMALTSTACENGSFIQTCYDPAPPPTNECLTNLNYQEVRNGESITLRFHCDFEDEATVTLYTSVNGNHHEELGELLQSEKIALTPEKEFYDLTIDVGKYTGIALVRIEYEMYTNDDYGISASKRDTYITIVE